MISRSLKIGLWTGLTVAGLIALVLLHIDNARLRTQVKGLDRLRTRIERLREENQRAQELVTRSKMGVVEATQAIHADVIRARSEVAELERVAGEKHARAKAQSTADAEMLASNHDPQKGLMLLDRFQNMGRGSPSAAFQTLVWAALKGDEAKLAEVSTISAPARAEAAALLSRLPEGSSGQWSPERLAAMFFTGLFNEVTAAQVIAETAQDPQHITLDIHLASGGKSAIMPMQLELGPTGWQVVFDNVSLGAVQKRIASLPVPSPRN